MTQQIPKLESKPVKIKGTHRYSFRVGEEAEVIGLRWARDRVCFMVLYADGFVDYIPMCDDGTYEFC